MTLVIGKNTYSYIKLNISYTCSFSLLLNNPKPPKAQKKGEAFQPLPSRLSEVLTRIGVFPPFPCVPARIALCPPLIYCKAYGCMFMIAADIAKHYPEPVNALLQISKCCFGLVGFTGILPVGHV